MINKQIRHSEETGQYEPEYTWDRFFTKAKTQKIKGRTTLVYDEKVS